MKRLLAILALTLFFAGPAAAGPQSAQASPPTSPFSETGRKAYDLVQKNDLSGAIALLEPLQEEGSLTEVEQAMLGALYIEVGRPGEAGEILAPLADRDDADAAVLYNAGRASMAMGLLPAAERYFKRSVALVPVSPAARDLGLLWGGQNRTFDAYRLLRPWALANPDDQEARIAAAACALRLEREAEADELIQGLPQSEPKVAMLRGQALLQEGNPEEALTVLEPLNETAPPQMRADLRRLLADIYVTLGRSQDAVELVPDGPGGDVRLALILSTAHYRQGDVDKALETLAPFTSNLPQRQRAGEPTGPFAPQLTFEYGRLLVAAGRSEEAIVYLETATALAPGNAPAWKSLGDALLGAGRRDDALEARKKFRDLSARENERRREEQSERTIKDPTTRSIVRAGEALERGEGQEALDILHREMLISPGDLRLFLTEVQILLKLDRKEAALERAAATLARFPDQPDALYQRGMANLALERTEAAEADLRRTLEMAPGHVAALNDLAVLLMVRGEREEARGLLERVLAERPDDETARRNLQRLDEAGG